MSEPIKTAEVSAQPFRFTPQQQIVLFCCLGLIACFFAPWTSLDQDVSAFGFQRYDKAGAALFAIPILAIITLLAYDAPQFLSRISVVTSITAWISVLYVLHVVGAFGLIALKWGASLTMLFALGLFAFSARRDYSLPFDLVAKKLNARKPSVYAHCLNHTPNINFSAKEFYQKLETAIESKQWPDVVLLRVEYSEAGLLSHKREYLRIIRQRQVFDICAAAFGADYFFSLREAVIPSVVNTRAVLSLLLGIFLFLIMSIHALGLIFGVFAWVFLLIFAIWFLFNVLRMGLTKVDQILVTLPVLGPAYEEWFRSDTYFQQDTRLIFLQSVTRLVEQEVEETISAKGVKLLDVFEKKPILDGLYKSHRKPL